MNKVKKFLDSELYLPIVFLISLSFWLVAYFSSHNKLDSELIYKVENISLITFGTICALLLVFFKNTYYFIPWVIFIPFVFARPFDAMTVPKCIYIGLAIMVVGLLIHIVLYKPKLKIGHFFWGLLVLGIALVLGGINIAIDWYQIFFTSLCAVAFLLVYSFIATSTKVRFKEISRLFTYLGIFLVVQLATYFAIQEDILSSMLTKMSNVGWGISNNIALMLLFTMPFTLYLVLKNKGFLVVIYVLLVAIQAVGIIFTYSRGSFIALGIGFVLLVPIVIWKSFDKKAAIISSCLVIIGLCTFVYLTYKLRNDLYTQFTDVLFKIDWDQMNGRTPIYEDCINSLKEYPIFGKGVFSMFTADPNGTDTIVYAWGHSTIFQTVRTMGLVGLAAMLIHLIQKYYCLLRRPSLWKLMTAFSFALSGLYGLFDVSYYFINYMIPLILAMAMIELLFKNDGEEITDL